MELRTILLSFKKNISIRILGLLLVFIFTNCKARQMDPAAAPVLPIESKNSFVYQINSPNQTFEMPEKLKEISGLSISPDGAQLCAVNDEDGSIFFINKKIGKIEKEVPFHNHGDYEGIETVGEHIFVVKSSGTVYKVSIENNDSASFKKAKYLLKKENDTEGLAYDAKNHQLLFACKGRACLHRGCRVDGCRAKKSIYSLDLNRNRVAKEPAFEITIDAVQAFLKKNKSKDELKKFNKFLKPKDGDFNFNPSALAIHPITFDIYILASKGKTLIVLQPDGKIKYIEKLSKKIHDQPEGLAFDTDGTMFISNEGKKEEAGKIYVFQPI